MLIAIQQLEGRDHYVVPTVLITEGVHHGSGGPLFYSAEQLQQSVRLWNGKPVVVYHPDLYTSEGSAGNPQVFNRQKVGYLFNTTFDGKRLKAEAWLNVERLQQVDARVFDALQDRKMMEVSTGLYSDRVPQPGIFNGKGYDAVVQRIVADHLAILPDQIGACSIKDGAGLLRNENSDVLLVPSLAF